MAVNDPMTLLPESEAWRLPNSFEQQKPLAEIETPDGNAADTIMQVHLSDGERDLRVILTALRRHGARR